MAMTTVVAPINAFDASGQLAGVSFVYANLTGDTSYPGGVGYAVSTATFNFSTKVVAVFATAPVAGNFTVRYDEFGKAVRWYLTSTTNALTEVSSGNSLSGQTVNVCAVGY